MEADDIRWNSFPKISGNAQQVCHQTFDDDIMLQMISSVSDLGNTRTLDLKCLMILLCLLLIKCHLNRFAICALSLWRETAHRKGPSWYWRTKGHWYQKKILRLDQWCFQRKMLSKGENVKTRKSNPQKKRNLNSQDIRGRSHSLQR